MCICHSAIMCVMKYKVRPHFHCITSNKVLLETLAIKATAQP